jgi:excinuclease ABC subunit A
MKNRSNGSKISDIEKVLKAGTNSDPMESDEPGEFSQIIVRGAREHNLKGIDIDIPRDKLIVITGLSGSGKSSLAFDTLYAEGQRRYVECMSAYARQFLGMLKKPKVDSIEGLSPAISIEQKSISHNPRSTVGTTTEVYDYLRLMFARIGVQYCVDCKIPVEKKTSDQIVEEIFKTYKGRRIQILAPIVRSRKGHYKEMFEQLMRIGFTKVRIDGEIREIVENLKVERYQMHNIELVVDRCVVEPEQEWRINESAQLALLKGEGFLVILAETQTGKFDEKLFSSVYSCPKCGRSYETLAPNMFSFNSPSGACPKCEGLGEIRDFDMSLVVPNDSVSIEDGGIAPLGKHRQMWLWSQLESYASANKVDLTQPIKKLPEGFLEKVVFGSDGETVSTNYTFSGGSQITYKHKYTGVLTALRHQYENTTSGAIRKNIENYMSSMSCPVCAGRRLKPENLAVKVNDLSIDDIVRQDVEQASKLFARLEKTISDREMKIARPILKAVIDRLNFLKGVGLSYLSLDRAVRTLSGGESQRIRLASQIGSELVGIMYVLDEPSIGLHPYDNDKLIESLKRLRDLGNTVIVVEHDKAMMENADHLIDMGPGAGTRGGEVVVSEAPEKFKKLSKKQMENSWTAQYLSALRKIDIPEKRRIGNGKRIILKGARGNNLQSVDLEIPLGVIVCITGLSGSGKSSLINDTLYPILSNFFYRSTNKPLPYDKIEGLDLIDKVIEIDQSPIGRTPRSNPATYTGVFSMIRNFFSLLTDSKIRGYKPGRFSFNVEGGRCEECGGAGIKKIEMNFLPEVYVTCDECGGKRYNKETLSVLYKGQSIADVLAMTVDDSIEFFAEIPKLRAKLQALKDVGLSYITLGQQAPTLSGGEAQRVKLAAELSKVSTGKTMYLLDEPTTGLHFEDIRILLKLLDKLVEKGNTVVIIEHNLDVIKFSDWIIDLGPKGGAEGGKIIATGTPEEIMKNSKSFTGKFLKKELN